MKSRMINTLILLMALCISSSSKENNHSLQKSCSGFCADGNASVKTIVTEQQEEAILSPVNLFMIHIQ